MDIHKPKPAHTPREFLSEILIIVIGVTIALAGEQGVEWLHWRHEVADTRRALLAELTGDLAIVARARREERCQAGLVDDLEAWASRPATANPLRTTRGTGLVALQTSAWEVAKTGQGAARVPLDERLALARVYNQIDEVNALNSALRATSTQFMPLLGRRQLNEAQRDRLLDAVAQLRIVYSLWSDKAAQFESQAKALGATPPPPAPLLKFPQECELPATM